MNELGYLFFRGLVPADEVLATRRDGADSLRRSGLA
jgi:hypothetical protein